MHPAGQALLHVLSGVCPAWEPYALCNREASPPTPILHDASNLVGLMQGADGCAGVQKLMREDDSWGLLGECLR